MPRRVKKTAREKELEMHLAILASGLTALLGDLFHDMPLDLWASYFAVVVDAQEALKKP